MTNEKPPRISANLKWLVATLLSAAGTGGGALWLSAPGAEARAEAVAAVTRAEKLEEKLEAAHEGRLRGIETKVDKIEAGQTRQWRLLSRVAAKLRVAELEDDEP